MALLTFRGPPALQFLLANMVTNGATVLFQPPITWTAGRFPVVVPGVVVARHDASINAGHRAGSYSHAFDLYGVRRQAGGERIRECCDCCEC